MLTREKMEQQQIGIYIVVLIAAIGLGLLFPQGMSVLDNPVLLSGVIAVLMYGMFTQIPFGLMQESLQDRRFVVAILLANYIAVPIVVWCLSWLLPQHPPILLGVYLVLLTPCVDYVIVFTHLGRGNEKLMLLATPILFITQMILLPVYLWLFMGQDAADIVNPKPFIEAFLIIIVIPLVIAVIVQLMSRKHRYGQLILDGSAWVPVPFMALTLFVVIASQMGKLATYWYVLIQVIPVYVLFMLIMPWISKGIVTLLRLEPASGRAVIFSSGTRNSLVVLPLALALPDDWNTLVAAIIVTQTVVELMGELVYIRVIPGWLLRDC
ncbi:arsenic resistance protein [Paenibacillus sp. WLX2291]|uniref:arsenic resistance protein n=1 Tax=Paenibacillus sp. WLX2291 TaxID=3296934 RepID=UPI003983EA0B